ncbi:MAG: isochorismatase family cysteine hydrolase, partial [Bacillota bacterium]|nr:isochorismatase family cysteine hydrolase [Bacillota bacterium]
MEKIPDFNKDSIALLCIDVQKVYDISDDKAKYEDWGAWNFKKVGENATRVLNACRQKGYPIIHAALCLDEHTIHPYDEVDENQQPIYSVKGTPGAEIIDSMKPLPGEIYMEKQRFSAFFQTNLDLLLRKLRIDHIIMVGGFTDACLLLSAYDAWARDYTITFVKDAITAGSEGAHKAGMIMLANWIYGCSIFETEEFEKALNNEKYSAWFW